MKKTNIADEAPEEFWALIEASRQDPIRFRELLKPMQRDEMVRFCWTYEELAIHLRTERHLRHAAKSLSEDAMAELANWVVAQGKARYREVLEHPERIPPRHDDSGFLSQLVEEYEMRHGDDLPPNTHAWDAGWRMHGKTSPWA